MVDFHNSNIKKCYDNLEMLKTELKDIQSKKIENIKQNNNLEKQNKDNNNTDNYKKNVQALPKDLQDIGEKLYSNKYRSAELAYVNTDHMKDEANLAKQSKLSTLENSIVKYMQDSDENRLSKPEIDNIKKLIYNAPIVNFPLYRGVNGEKYKDKKVGDDVDFEVRSFSSKNSIAEDFIEHKAEENPALFHINTPCKALDIQPYGFYTESEYFVAGKYKIDQIKEKEIRGKTAKVFLISPKEE